MPNKAQQSLRGSYGTFGQARRDLSPLEEQEEGAWQRAGAHAAGVHLQMAEGKQQKPRRKRQLMLDSLDGGLVKIAQRNDAWQW